MVTVRPAIVSVALRAAPEFGCAVTVTVPLPAPLPATLTHAAPDDVDQSQVLVVLTVTVAAPPVLEKLSEVGDTV